MYINHDSSSGELLKIYLTKEERSLLNYAIQLPPSLAGLVRDSYIKVNKESFRSDLIDENGYPIDSSGRKIPISWLSSPYQCRNWLSENPNNRLLLVHRRPALKPRMPYDFERVLIRTSLGL